MSQAVYTALLKICWLHVNIWSKALKGDLNIDGREVLKFIFGKWRVKIWRVQMAIFIHNR
jgi:hypothetical protein